MKRAPLTCVLAICIATTATTNVGCAALASKLPDVIMYVQDGALILNAIRSFSDAFFAGKPNATAQGKVNDAINKAYAALDIALRAAHGAKDMTENQIAAAFAEFQIAYTELIALVGDIGVKAQGAALMASPGALTVPVPLAMMAKVK